jgi:hypothetical protein
LPSYASILLSCLAKIFESDAFDWSILGDDSLLQLVARNALSHNINVQRPALDSLAAIAKSARFGFACVSASLQRAYDAAVANNSIGIALSMHDYVVNLLAHQDFSVQKSALNFIATMISAANQAGCKSEYLGQIDKVAINDKVKV